MYEGTNDLYIAELLCRHTKDGVLLWKYNKGDKGYIAANDEGEEVVILRADTRALGPTVFVDIFKNGRLARSMYEPSMHIAYSPMGRSLRFITQLLYLPTRPRFPQEGSKDYISHQLHVALNELYRAVLAQLNEPDELF